MPEEESAESIKMPTPPLKLNAEMDDLDFEPSESVEPAEQIDSIKQLITGVEENFESSPLIEPEIELSFDEFEHPFQEPFEHEEIVSDRYAAPTSALSVLQSVVPVFSFGTLGESPFVQEVAQEVVFEEKLEKTPEGQADFPKHAKDTIPLPRNAAVAMFEPEKNPVLIVEEDQPIDEAQSPPPVRPVPPLRRNEYSRLFAKLRQA
jgi:hypothetical protein